MPDHGYSTDGSSRRQRLRQVIDSQPKTAGYAARLKQSRHPGGTQSPAQA